MNESRLTRKVEMDDRNAWPCTLWFMTSGEFTTPSLGAIVFPGVTAPAVALRYSIVVRDRFLMADLVR